MASCKQTKNKIRGGIPLNIQPLAIMWLLNPAKKAKKRPKVVSTVPDTAKEKPRKDKCLLLGLAH
jgi:hypothetical protein